MSFASLAFLLTPASGDDRGLILQADEGWTLDLPDDSLDIDVVVWGRPPWPSGEAMRRAVSSAWARERVVLALKRRPPSSFASARVHRWPPPVLRPGPRNAPRAALRAGALIELLRSRGVPRVIDAVAEAAGERFPVPALRPGSGGAALVRFTHPGGGRMLRAGRQGDRGDPRRASEALEHLAAARLRKAPRLLGAGTIAGASWIKEQLLPGRRPSHMSKDLFRSVALFCSRLPQAEGPAAALGDDLDAIAGRLPHLAKPLAYIEEECDSELSSIPAIMRHGDLWAGNVLVQGSHLTGVVDWDAWHESAVPGADLLHLVATHDELKSGRSLGRVWLDRPWQKESFTKVSSAYWKELRIRPSAGVLKATGVAWWANQVAASMERLPHLSKDELWLQANVEPVVDALRS